MTVKRYTNFGVDMIEFDSGEYVHLDDYAELQRQLTAYEATLTNFTAAALAEIRGQERADIATQLEAKAAEYEESAKSSEGFAADNRYRFAAAMFRGFAQQLGKEQRK